MAFIKNVIFIASNKLHHLSTGQGKTKISQHNETKNEQKMNPFFFSTNQQNEKTKVIIIIDKKFDIFPSKSN